MEVHGLQYKFIIVLWDNMKFIYVENFQDENKPNYYLKIAVKHNSVATPHIVSLMHHFLNHCLVMK